MSLIKKLKPCKLKGDFVLASGQRAKEYYDFRRACADPLLLDEIATAIYEKFEEGITCVAGLGFGSHRLVTAVGLKSGLMMVGLRREFGGHAVIKK